MELPRKTLAAIHLLLSRLFLKEADAALMVELARPEIAEPLDLLEPGVAAYIRDTDWSDAALEDLAAAYTALFLMPEGVSPFAVAWMEGEEGQIRAHLTDQISTLYEALRIQPTDFGLGNVPADHIGMLLALRGVAFETERGAADEGLAGRAAALVRPWASKFSADLVEKAENPLYRAAGRLLEEVLDYRAAQD